MTPAELRGALARGATEEIVAEFLRLTERVQQLTDCLIEAEVDFLSIDKLAIYQSALGKMNNVRKCCDSLPILTHFPDDYPGSIRYQCPVCQRRTFACYSTVGGADLMAARLWNDRKLDDGSVDRKLNSICQKKYEPRSVSETTFSFLSASTLD